MASLNATASHGGSGSIPSFDTVFLESVIPGYSLASRLLATYFHFDLTFYLPLIVTCAASFAAVRYSFNWLRELYELVRNYFVCTAEISPEDEIYTYLMYWMTTQPVATRATSFVAGTKLRNSRYSYYDSDDEADSDDDNNSHDDPDETEASFDAYWARTVSRDRFKPLRFTPSKGTYYFKYNGRYIAFSREREENKQGILAGLSNNMLSPERLYLSCVGRNPQPIKDLLAEAQRAYVARDGNRTVIYRGQKQGVDYLDWVRCMARPPRPLSTVVLDKPQKDAFIADIKEYLHPRTRRWYSNRGIPYRRGYLLHGPPGTGKTSLCFAASGMLGLTLYLLNLNAKSLDEDGLMSLFSELPRRCIVLLEDVDSAGITKKRAEDDPNDPKSGTPEDGNATKLVQSAVSSAAAAAAASAAAGAAGGGTGAGGETTSDHEKPAQGLSLSALLNVIDGVTASEGRILVMTTNHAEKLDPALLRPGRVDMTITFGYAARDDIEELFRAIYSMLEGDVRKRRAPKTKAKAKAEAKANGTAVVTDEETKKERKIMVARREYMEKVPVLANEFASRVPAGEFTAAEIQGYLLNHKHAPHEAIDGVEAWVANMRDKKDKQKKNQA